MSHAHLSHAHLSQVGFFQFVAGKVDICEVREDKASLVAKYRRAGFVRR